MPTILTAAAPAQAATASGVFSLTWLLIALPLLGIHPTLETLAAQVAVIGLVAIAYWLMREREPAH